VLRARLLQLHHAAAGTGSGTIATRNDAQVVVRA
jgi:hypothetical protein